MSFAVSLLSRRPLGLRIVPPPLGLRIVPPLLSNFVTHFRNAVYPFFRRSVSLLSPRRSLCLFPTSKVRILDLLSFDRVSSLFSASFFFASKLLRMSFAVSLLSLRKLRNFFVCLSQFRYCLFSLLFSLLRKFFACVSQFRYCPEGRLICALSSRRSVCALSSRRSACSLSLRRSVRALSSRRSVGAFVCAVDSSYD